MATRSLTVEKDQKQIQVPPLGIDLDGTIDEAPVFFQFLTQTYPGKVYIITYRDDPAKIKRDVERSNVRCDELILASSFEQKAVIIERLGIKVFFDDMDEALLHIPEGVVVMKIRNGGNSNYAQRKWLYSRQTGYSI